MFAFTASVSQLKTNAHTGFFAAGIGCILSVILAVLIVASDITSVLSYVPPLIIVAIAAAVANVRLHFWLLSPVAIAIGVYVSVALSASVISTVTVDRQYQLSSFAISRSETYDAYLTFIGAGTAIAVGAVVYSFLRHSQAAGLLRLQPTPATVNLRRVASIGSTVPLLMQVLGHGTTLLVRPQYLDAPAGDPFLVAASTLSLPAVALLGWLSAAAVTIRGKLRSYVILVGYGLVFFALGTRAFAMVPLLFAIGRVVAKPKGRRAVIWLASAGLVSLLLLPTPLFLRHSQEHGLVPYLGLLLTSTESFLPTDTFAIISNVLFSFDLTAIVGFRLPPLDTTDMLVSLDPRFGSFTSWYDLQPALRVNEYIPFNALGELASAGWPWLVGFFLVVGAYFGHLDRRTRTLIASGHSFSALLLLALAGYFIILTLEYNLRSSARVLYYLFAIDVVIAIQTRILIHQGTTNAGINDSTVL